jgi:uncharacterized damage-inducible protein DinB
MNNGQSLHKEFLNELEAEAGASRKCLERIPEKYYDWKPHERSMAMRSLTHVVADIPRWIQQIVDTPAIDFATYNNVQLKTTFETVNHFDTSLRDAKQALEYTTDEALTEMFSLKNKGHVLMRMQKKDFIANSINHLVHHRGQLTVYMRLNNIPVPMIYGPSADEGSF